MLDTELETLPRLIFEARAAAHSQAIPPRPFEGYVWFDETNAIIPLPGKLTLGEHAEVDETNPFGL